MYCHMSTQPVIVKIADTQTEYKVVMIGDGAVGKTTLLESFIKGKFNPLLKTTVGADFSYKEFSTDGGGKTRLVIWDIGGQPRFADVAETFFYGARGVVLVFDVTHPVTLDSLNEWVARFRITQQKYIESIRARARDQSLASEHIRRVERVSMMVVGNKTDLVECRKVPCEDGKQFAKKIGATYLETTAKEPDQAGKVFTELARVMANKVPLP